MAKHFVSLNILGLDKDVIVLRELFFTDLLERNDIVRRVIFIRLVQFTPTQTIDTDPVMTRFARKLCTFLVGFLGNQRQRVCAVDPKLARGQPQMRDCRG